MKIKIYITLSVILIIPFLLNVIGKNTYLHINIGKKDIILASAIGVFHYGYADKMDFSDLSMTQFEESIGYTNSHIIKGETINLFTERSDTIQPFTFRIIEADSYSNYSGFEFPWLLLWFIPTFLAIQNFRKKKENEREQKDQPNGYHTLR